MCSGSEAGSYLRLMDFVYHSTLGLRVIKKKKRGRDSARYEIALYKVDTARWATTLSSKVNLHHTINCRVICGPNLVTRWSRSPQNQAERTPRTPPCGKWSFCTIQFRIILCTPLYKTCLPLSSESGTYKTVKTRFWPWLSGQSPLNLLSCSLLARHRNVPDASARDRSNTCRAKREQIKSEEGTN